MTVLQSGHTCGRYDATESTETDRLKEERQHPLGHFIF